MTEHNTALHYFIVEGLVWMILLGVVAWVWAIAVRAWRRTYRNWW